jgi:glycerol-3-phosphate dehydrogenase
MWAYDLTGGFRIGKFHERLDQAAALAHMPTLPADKLAAAYLYHDAQADDARLTLTVARTAATEHGAAVANRTRVVGFDNGPDGRIRAVRVHAEGVGPVPDRDLSIRTTAVVNATGVWADDVRAIDEGTHPDSIRPAKGIHITVPWDKVRNDIAVVIPVPGDKRSVFVVPWPNADGGPGYTYVGTTDTDYDGPLDDPQCTPDDVAYLLSAINACVTTDIDERDVVGTWAGLRPLVKDTGSGGSGRTADLSRRHSVRTSPSGMVTVTGGKLTTYREMAADAIDEVVRQSAASIAGRVAKRSRTAKLRLRGAEGYTEVRDGGPGNAPVASQAVAHLADRYGGDARVLLAMTEADPSLAETLVPGTPYLAAEAVYAARYEMATSVDDVLSRRTRARLLARDASADAAERVAELIGPVLGLDATQRAGQVAAYRQVIDEERTTPGLDPSTRPQSAEL